MIFTKEQFASMPRAFQKDGEGKLKEILAMDDPVLSPYPFIYFTCDRDPLPTDTTYSGYAGLIYFWYNTTSTNLFCCTDCSTAGALVWQEIAMPQNILSMLSGAGWQINTSRNYVQRTSPAFSTPYIPSTTNDTQVIVVVTLTSTLLTTAEVNIQVNTGLGYTIVAESSVSGVAATNVYSMTFTVPANASYQVATVSGSTSITQIMELTQ
jgi:hypothetical protein